MELKIIGWTNYSSKCQNIIVTEENQMEVIDAVLKAIKENDYVFCGDHHQSDIYNCVPVFNNGKCYRASMRTIAYFMSMLWSKNADGSDYMNYYMQQNSNITNFNFPKEQIDSSNFVIDEGQDAVLPIIIQNDMDLIIQSLQCDMELMTTDKAIISNYEYYKNQLK